MNNYFPLFVSLQERKVWVIGGGKIATRRILRLMDFSENITVIATYFSKEVLANKDKLTLINRAFEENDLFSFAKTDLVLALSDNALLNKQIAKYCHMHNILVNVSTDKDLCSFYFPYISMHHGAVAGLTANGQHHQKAKFMGERMNIAMQKEIIIGSRESKLAVMQSNTVLDYLVSLGLPTKLLTMKTTGDIILDKTLDKVGGKGLFTKELDKALQEKRSDLSVHSLKDMPAETHPEFALIGYSKREDPRDVLVLPKNVKELDFSKPIGCASFRRTLLLKALFPQATIKPVRGNVLTRLEKLDSGEYGALVLAAAGLHRLGLAERISRYFSPDEILPAAGQGIIAVEGRKNEDYSYLSGYFDADSKSMALAERSFIATLNGGCSSPIGAYSTINGDELNLTGLYYHEETEIYYKDSMSMPREKAVELGAILANKLKERGLNDAKR